MISSKFIFKVIPYTEGMFGLIIVPKDNVRYTYEETLELAISISKSGLLQAPTVMASSRKTPDKKTCVIGNSRIEALKLLESGKAIKISQDTNDKIVYNLPPNARVQEVIDTYYDEVDDNDLKLIRLIETDFTNKFKTVESGSKLLDIANAYCLREFGESWDKSKKNQIRRKRTLFEIAGLTPYTTSQIVSMIDDVSKHGSITTGKTIPVNDTKIVGITFARIVDKMSLPQYEKTEILKTAVELIKENPILGTNDMINVLYTVRRNLVDGERIPDKMRRIVKKPDIGTPIEVKAVFTKDEHTQLKELGKRMRLGMGKAMRQVVLERLIKEFPEKYAV